MNAPNQPTGPDPFQSLSLRAGLSAVLTLVGMYVLPLPHWRSGDSLLWTVFATIVFLMVAIVIFLAITVVARIVSRIKKKRG